MKLKYFFQVIFLLVIISSIICSQSFELIELKGKIKFGNKPGELGKNIQSNSAIPTGFTPEDIIFDNDNNIYICDRFSKRIIKYDSELKFIFEIQMDDEHFQDRLIKYNNTLVPEATAYEVHLDTDKYRNLYVLITHGESFYRIIKYNKKGELINNFKLGEPYPMQRTIGIIISSKDRILVKTSSYSPVNSTYFQDGLIFVYDLNGKFLGRTDYSIDGSNGYIYKRNTTADKRNMLWIDRFEPLINGNIDQTLSLKLDASLHVNLPVNTSMPFIGIDRKNKLYFAGSNPGSAPLKFLIEIFDFSDNKVTEISLDRKEVENRLHNQFNTVLFHNPFVLSPDGNIYLCGIKSNNSKINSAEKINSDDIELNILKLQLTNRGD